MDGLSSLKVVVFPDLEDKVLSVDKKCFFPASTSVSCRSTHASAVLFDKQTSNGERIDSRKQTEEPKNANNKKQFSCPSIIDFNTLKFYQEIKPVHKPKRIFNGFFPSRVRSINAGLPCAYKEIHNVRVSLYFHFNYNLKLLVSVAQDKPSPTHQTQLKLQNYLRAEIKKTTRSPMGYELTLWLLTT